MLVSPNETAAVFVIMLCNYSFLKYAAQRTNNGENGRKWVFTKKIQIIHLQNYIKL